MSKDNKALIERLKTAEKIIETVAMYGRINHDRPKDYRELCQDYINEFMSASQEAAPKKVNKNVSK